MSIVCEEVFDEVSHPSVEEIKDYAIKIGINPDTEPQLLSLASEGLMKALPPGWRPCYDDKSKRYYYYNELNKKTQWEHPLDDAYRKLVKKARTESQSLSLNDPTEDATYAKDDELDTNPLSEAKLHPIHLAPQLSPSKKLNNSKLLKQRSEDVLGGNKLLRVFTSFDEDGSTFDKHPRALDENEFKVVGDGAMFLKSRTKNLNPLSPGDKSDDLNVPKSILREKFMEHSKSMDFDKISQNDRSDKDDEDKKSVRFNLDNNTTDLGITFSDKSSGDDEDSNFSDKPILKPDNETHKPGLKLIKVPPKLTINDGSDSDESNANDLKKIDDMFQSESDSSMEDHVKAKLEAKAEKKLAEFKQKLWEKTNTELMEFRVKLEESQRNELDNILLEEKAKIEQNHSTELTHFKAELEEKLKTEKVKLSDSFEKQKLELENEFANQLEGLRVKFEQQKNEQVNQTAKNESDLDRMQLEKTGLLDKYRCLKEKYFRLKSELKAVESRRRHRYVTVSAGANTTGSETEKSPNSNDNLPKKPLGKPPPSKGIIIQDHDTSVSDNCYQSDDKMNQNDSSESVNPKTRKKSYSRHTPSDIKVNFNSSSKSTVVPVENLRRQLQKLEDLEDQFPQSSQDTYHLRYPFSDGQKFQGSSELEFFRHRIHLEKDSIKRAKLCLRNQKVVFQQRQKELKLKHGTMARQTLQQLCQEEKELTEMEVNLHRTRSLLGEKVIRLRHLQQSLHRANTHSDQNKHEDATLSDVSSQSSGISSTEFAGYPNTIGKTDFPEPSGIIQSLENLNLEIQEIWDVLKTQQRQSGISQAFPNVDAAISGTRNIYAPSSIPTLADRLHNYRQHVALSNAQSTVVTQASQGATTTLIERTRKIRHWLKQNGTETCHEANNSHTSL